MPRLTDFERSLLAEATNEVIQRFKDEVTNVFASRVTFYSHPPEIADFLEELESLAKALQPTKKRVLLSEDETPPGRGARLQPDGS